MRRMAATIYKGGTGKTSFIMNMACRLGELGYKTLVMDLDPQRNLSLWFKTHEELENLPTIYDVFMNECEITDIIVGTDKKNVYLAPCEGRFAGIERDLKQRVGTQEILKNKMEILGEDIFDYVLIDTSRDIDLSLINALIYVDKIIIPVVDTLSLEGLKETILIFEEVKEINKNLSVAGIVLNMCTERTKLAKFMRSKLSPEFGDLILKNSIPETVRMREAPGLHKSIFEHGKETLTATKYMYAVDEIINKWE